MEFKHPKYYKELRKRNKSDQAISLEDSTESVCGVRPGPGLKLPGPRPISNANKGLIHRRQAASSKLQATQTQLETNCSSDKNPNPQASSDKLQAPSRKHQAPSRKRQAP